MAMSDKLHNFWTRHLLNGRTRVQPLAANSTVQFTDQTRAAPLQEDDEDFGSGYAANEAGVWLSLRRTMLFS